MGDPLAEVFAAFDRPFRELADELAHRHPEARFWMQSNPVGTGAYLGHMFFVECFWPGRGPDEPDNVALGVEVRRLTTSPRVNADVCWGHGRIETEFVSDWSSSDDWPPATPVTLQQLTARMPELMDEFRRVVARGRPTEQKHAEPNAALPPPGE